MSAGWGSHIRQLLHFLLGSCLGLAVDLSIFALGIRVGAAPWLANTLSAGSAVVVVYLFVTKYAFRTERSRSSFVAFVAWYLISIVLFSVLIELLSERTGWAPFLCKLVSLPFSFGANFGVSKFLFRERSGVASRDAGVRGEPQAAVARDPGR